jgi:hypothetical protein
MLRSGVALMQQARKGMAQVLPFAHRGLEQRFLNIARHVAPNGHRRLAQKYGKSLLFGHVDPPAFRRLTEFKVPKAGINPMSHPIRARTRVYSTAQPANPRSKAENTEREKQADGHGCREQQRAKTSQPVREKQEHSAFAPMI